MIMALSLLLALNSVDVPAEVKGCLTVQSERIFVGDVVAAVPGFSALPADLFLGYAPTPGVQRILSGATLQAIAKNHGITLTSVPNVCFVQPMTELQPEEILEAMRDSWSGAEVRIEVRSWNPRIAPQGKLVFPKSGLQLPSSSDPEAEALWRGYVLYGNNQRFTVSARARVVTSATRVVAIDNVSAGSPIREDQVRLETCDSCPLDDRPARSLDEVVGLVPRSFIRAGATILRSQLNRAPDVSKGDVVSVDASTGGAHLVVEGRAQSSGVIGSTVTVKNLTSGKDFRAEVTGTKKVRVQ
jgi:flagella basal body P-ring formation protein FlgA